MRPVVLLLLLTSPCAAQISTGMGASTGNPVSMVFERTQPHTLADGTHITNVTHEQFYRDSEGRTRTDHDVQLGGQSGGAPRSLVTVQDPVARFTLHWQTGGSSTAPRQFTSIDQDVLAERMPMRQPVHQAGDDPPLPQLHHAPVAPQEQTAERPRPTHTLKNLGTQQLLGASCEASRITVVYPPGSFGNDRPVTTTTERCMSHEFGRALREVVNDPRSGTRTLTVQSITRGEPDPMLFHPPADYAERSQTP